MPRLNNTPRTTFEGLTKQEIEFLGAAMVCLKQLFDACHEVAWQRQSNGGEPIFFKGQLLFMQGEMDQYRANAAGIGNDHSPVDENDLNSGCWAVSNSLLPAWRALTCANHGTRYGNYPVHPKVVWRELWKPERPWEIHASYEARKCPCQMRKNTPGKFARLAPMS